MQYLLTEEEYLTLTKETADSLLRETNSKLKATVDELQAKLNQTPTVVESKFDSPFIAVKSKLCLRNYTDFIVLYNSLAQPTLNDSDKEVYDYLTKLASNFNYESQFESQKDLKAYRVSLQKKNLFNQVVKDGKRYLEFTDAKF